MKKKMCFALIMILVCILACGILACGNTEADPLIAEKTAAINEVNAVVLQKNSADYTPGNWATIELCLQNVITKINSASDIATINSAKQEAIDKINAVETIAQEDLRLEKEIAIIQMESLLTYLNEAEYSEENWAEIITLFEGKKNEVNRAQVMNAIISHELYQQFYKSTYLVDKTADIYATIGVTIDGATENYRVRYRCDGSSSYEFDQGYQQDSGLPSLSEKLRVMPKKDGYIFLGWFFSPDSDIPYDFSIIFAPLTPQAQHVFARFKQIPTAPIACIDDIVGTWTAQYESGSGTVGNTQYSVFADATLIIDEFGLMTFSATYTIEGLSEAKAQDLFDTGVWARSKELKILCEFGEYVELTEYDITYYNLFYYDSNAGAYSLYPEPSVWRFMQMQDGILSLYNGAFTKQA